MEKPIFPSKYIRITQGYNVGTHKDSLLLLIMLEKMVVLVQYMHHLLE